MCRKKERFFEIGVVSDDEFFTHIKLTVQFLNNFINLNRMAKFYDQTMMNGKNTQ